MPGNPNRKRRQRARPQQLTALKERETVAADAVRRYCPEPDCVIELPPWAAAHPGLHRRCTFEQYDRAAKGLRAASRIGAVFPDWIYGKTSPWMWGRVGQPYRLGDLREIKDQALGMVVARHCDPADLDGFEATIRQMEYTAAHMAHP
jgi:hypothetical protein